MFRMAGAVALLATSVLTSPAHATTESKTFCVYDPVGTAGDAYRTAEDFQVDAQAQGVSLKLKAYTDEATAAADLRSGKCAGALLTGVRANIFNLQSYTLEAMGALPTYGLLKETVKRLSSEKAAKLMRHGDYETAGIYPAGAVYLYVRDRTWTKKSDLSGKKVATLDFDRAARTMVDQVGASMIPADIGTFAGMFNNGAVDVVYAPATAYTPLELYRGLGNGGGVVRYPIAQLTLQVIIRHGEFPENFGVWSRSYAYNHFDKMIAMVNRTEGEVKSEYWVDIPTSDKDMYDAMFRDVRIGLRDNGTYNAKMLKLMKIVRCREDGTRAECVMETE